MSNKILSNIKNTAVDAGKLCYYGSKYAYGSVLKKTIPLVGKAGRGLCGIGLKLHDQAHHYESLVNANKPRR
jgi:hypothetical protein